eukprot:75896-Prorocentrum_minimum.AAC.2
MPSGESTPREKNSPETRFRWWLGVRANLGEEWNSPVAKGQIKVRFVMSATPSPRRDSRLEKRRSQATASEVDIERISVVPITAEEAHSGTVAQWHSGTVHLKRKPIGEFHPPAS